MEVTPASTAMRIFFSETLLHKQTIMKKPFTDTGSKRAAGFQAMDTYGAGAPFIKSAGTHRATPEQMEALRLRHCPLDHRGPLLRELLASRAQHRR